MEQLEKLEKRIDDLEKVITLIVIVLTSAIMISIGLYCGWI